MAMTLNGNIANQDDTADWISGEEWDSYSSAVRSVGNLIIGRRTYNILTKQPEFSELKDVNIVVVSEKGIETIAGNHHVANFPKHALDLFKNEERVVVAGGSILNTSFLREELVDEVYVDVEPVILGLGIPFSQREDFYTKLEYIGIKKLSENTIQLHYKVVKPKLV